MEKFIKQPKFPNEYSFEIFPSVQFQEPIHQMALQQLSRIYDILHDEKYFSRIPIIVGNSVTLDMLQDYFNQCSTPDNFVDEYCQALISINGCSTKVLVHQNRFLIFVVQDTLLQFNNPDYDTIPI
jgi:hypothetical protein